MKYTVEIKPRAMKDVESIPIRDAERNEEFEALRELAEDYEDLRDFREAKAQEQDAPKLSLREVRTRLGL
jgi:hypothetical protein